jgi:aryl-alcohol dehydrogenase-like predicted oxidoreductase
VDRRQLGASDIWVSPLGLGTWAMGATVETWGHVDDRESIAAIHQAIDSGINLIDTAPIYGLGHSEEVVGKAIQGRRDDLVIATKCGLLFPTENGKEPARCLKKDSVITECEQSLRRLGTDVIDLYQCHWPDPDTPIRETFEAFSLLRKQGKIRAAGVSNFGCEKISAATEFGPVDSLQPPFSMLHPRAAEDLIPYCKEHNIAVLPYGPLSKGLLTGKFGPESTFEDIRERDPEFVGNRYQRNLRIVDSLKEIAAGYEKTVTQLVLNWTMNFPGVTAPLVGAKRPSQVEEHVGAIGWDISSTDMTKIDRILGGSPGDA